MSKKRKALRFATAGAVSTLYGLVIQQSLSGRYAQEMKDRKINVKQVVIVAGSMMAATWIVALA